MYDRVMKEKEMLHKLNNDLEEIKTFLIGDTCTETCEQQNENCLQDTMIRNLQAIDNALVLTNIIKETIKGGNK